MGGDRNSAFLVHNAVRICAILRIRVPGSSALTWGSVFPLRSVLWMMVFAPPVGADCGPPLVLIPSHLSVDLMRRVLMLCRFDVGLSVVVNLGVVVDDIRVEAVLTLENERVGGARRSPTDSRSKHNIAHRRILRARYCHASGAAKHQNIE